MISDSDADDAAVPAKRQQLGADHGTPMSPAQQTLCNAQGDIPPEDLGAAELQRTMAPGSGPGVAAALALDTQTPVVPCQGIGTAPAETPPQQRTQAQAGVEVDMVGMRQRRARAREARAARAAASSQRAAAFKAASLQVGPMQIQTAPGHAGLEP